MDKEKLLKKFIAKFVVGQTLASAFIFLWIFAHEYGYISKDQFITKDRIRKRICTEEYPEKIHYNKH